MGWFGRNKPVRLPLRVGFEMVGGGRALMKGYIQNTDTQETLWLDSARNITDGDQYVIDLNLVVDKSGEGKVEHSDN